MRVTGWIKYLLVLIFTAGLLVSMTACSFGGDISRQMIVQGIGVDTSENGYLVSVHYLRANQEVTTDLIQSEGQTVFEALQNIRMRTGLTPTYSHNAMVVFGKKCAEDGLSDVFDFFIRHYETRPTVQLFVAEDRAETLFELNNGDSYLLAVQARSYAETGDSANKFANSTVLDITNQMLSESPAFAMAEIKSDNEHIQLGNTAYFRDNRLIGYLDREQTRGYLAAAHSIQGGAVVLDVPDVGVVGLNLEKTNKKITVQIIDGIPHFQIDVTCSGYISEINQDIGRMLSPTVYQQFEESLNQKLKRQIEFAVEQAVIQDQTDIFYFGTALQQQQTAYWKEHQDTWEEIMGRIQYTVNVQSSIDRVQQEANPVA